MSARAAPIRSTDTIVRSIGLSSSVNLLILAPGEETVKALVAYRLLAPGSEWRLHREWFQQRFGRSAGRGCRARRDPQTVPTSTAASVHRSNQFRNGLSLERTGFEPSVPRGKGPTLRVSVLFRSDFRLAGNQAEATLKDWSCHAGPRVRILFPPARSQKRTRAPTPAKLWSQALHFGQTELGLSAALRPVRDQ